MADTKPSVDPKNRLAALADSNKASKSTSERVTDTVRAKKSWVVPATIFLCMVAGFFGGWLALTSLGDGVGGSDQINNNRETIVLQEGELIADIAQKISPSVVSITVENVRVGLFQNITSEGAGTGVILSADGLVVTNKHVIQGAQNIRIVAQDGTKYDNVDVVDTDPSNDIAFLRIRGVRSLTAARIGDSSQMRIGQKVVAIGNALGQFSHTVTSGIISGIGRPIVAGGEFGEEPESLQNLFQTDAAINPGNSGGPLVNIAGEVIGITTAVAGNAENIGFAIPINDVKPAIESVKTHNRLIKPYLGVRYIMINPDIAEQHSLTRSQGALIARTSASPAVVPNSPAAKAGLKENDIVTKINDTTLDQQNNLASVVSRLKVGEKVTLIIVRGGEEQTIDTTLGEAAER
jgi:serine protease Do